MLDTPGMPYAGNVIRHGFGCQGPRPFGLIVHGCTGAAEDRRSESRPLRFGLASRVCFAPCASLAREFKRYAELKTGQFAIGNLIANRAKVLDGHRTSKALLRALALPARFGAGKVVAFIFRQGPIAGCG